MVAVTALLVRATSTLALAGLDFESKILVKTDAPGLLRKQLSSPRWEPKVLSMSGVTDPYQPVEKKLRITRRCLEGLVEVRNPVVIVTKNHLVTRDVGLLSELALHGAAAVAVSLTTLEDDLRRIMEPRTSRPVASPPSRSSPPPASR